MPKGKEKLASPGRRTRAYEMPNLVNIQGSQDPLQQIEDQAIRDLNNEYRTLRVEQMIEKKRREVEKMRNGGDIDMRSMPSNADFMKMARMMSDLSPEEQKKVANAYAVLKMADRGQMGGSLGLLGQLMGYARSNPGASEDQMIKYLSLMDSQMVKGMEMMKAANPPKPQGDPVGYMVKGMEMMKTANPSKQDNPMEFLKLMKDLVIEGVRNPLINAIEKSQPTPGVFDQIFTNPDLWNRFKEIGIFGGGESRAGSTETDLKIEQLRRESALEMKKLDLAWKKTTLETEAKERGEDRRTDAILTALAPLSAILSGPVDQRMRQLGQQQASAYNPTGIPPEGTPPLNENILIKCSCGYQGPITFEGPAPDRFNCPSCGIELKVGGTPSGENK